MTEDRQTGAPLAADPLTYLAAVLDAAQRDAEDATWHESAGTWIAYHREKYDGRWTIIDSLDDGVITTVDPQASDDKGVAAHVARHDPSSVLRRIAADRTTLALHRDVAGKCSECGQGYEALEWGPDFPCQTIRNLAEGWGWTQEEQQ